MSSDAMSVLSSSHYLAPLSDEDRQALAGISRFRRYDLDEVIIGQADPVHAFYVVSQGRVKKLRAMPNGRQVVLGLYGPGMLFGTADAIGSQPSHGALIALTPGVVLLEIPRRDLFTLLAKRAELSLRLLVTLTPHFTECKNCIVELACLRIEARLAQLLMKLASNAGYEKDGLLFVPIALSRQDLADMTGTTIETCIRIMSRWHKEKVVETRDDGFLIHDLQSLSRLSGG